MITTPTSSIPSSESATPDAATAVVVDTNLQALMQRLQVHQQRSGYARARQERLQLFRKDSLRALGIAAVISLMINAGLVAALAHATTRGMQSVAAGTGAVHLQDGVRVWVH